LKYSTGCRISSVSSKFSSGNISFELVITGFSFERYTVLNNFTKNYENSSAGRGARSYLLNGVCSINYHLILTAHFFLKEVDIVLAAVISTAERYREVDLTFPWTSDSYCLTIPFPVTSADINAPWKPFETEVLSKSVFI
jgi:hypothetical protein